MSKLRDGRGWAYAGAWLGGAMSVAGNIGHSFVRPDSVPATWEPNPGAVAVSAIWPLGLVIVAEVVIRTPWPKAWYWIALRLLGLVPVGVVSGVVSFRHLRDLLAFFGEDTVIQVLGPLAVDGLMITCAASLFATAERARSGQTDKGTPLAVRLAGQFAAVRSMLSTDKVVQPERTTDTDSADTDNAAGQLSTHFVLPEDSYVQLVSGQDKELSTEGLWMADTIADNAEDKPRPVSLSLSERVSAIALAFPDRIPKGREVKAELGITSQGVVTDVLRELKALRATTTENKEG